MKSIHWAALSLIAALASIVPIGLSGLRAEEPAPPPAPPAVTPPVPPTVNEAPKDAPAKADEKKPDDKTAAEPDPYVIPQNADSNALVAFCKNMLEQRRKIKKREEFMTYQSKMVPAMKEACAQILKLENSETTDNARFAKRNVLSLAMPSQMSGTEATANEFLASVEKYAEAKELNQEDVTFCSQAMQAAEYGKSTKAIEFIQKLSDLFKKSTDEKIAARGQIYDAVIRRLSLVGKPMELKGTSVDGKAFDLDSLKGKVVLVDFWATWCGPCRAELPNVKKNYEGYHNKGFEVVGISGDHDRKALDAFLEKDKLPWTTLHDANGHNGAMDTYGIRAFPTTLLIGKDGNVVALNVRGPQLGELLKTQLGEPEEVKPEPAAPTETPAKPEAATPAETPAKTPEPATPSKS